MVRVKVMRFLGAGPELQKSESESFLKPRGGGGGRRSRPVFPIGCFCFDSIAYLSILIVALVIKRFWTSEGILHSKFRLA